MSSRVRALLQFLGRAAAIQTLMIKSGLPRVVVIGNLVLIWTDQAAEVDKGFLVLVAQEQLLEPPFVRHGETWKDKEGKGGVYSAFPKETGKREEIQESTHTEVLGVPRGKGAISEQIASLRETWKETLKHFGIERGISIVEESLMGRFLQLCGFETVDLALRGARFEAKTERFDPANHVSIGRVLQRGRIDKFANLGAQKPKTEREQQKKVVQRAAALDGLGRPMFDDDGNPIDYTSTTE